MSPEARTGPPLLGSGLQGLADVLLAARREGRRLPPWPSTHRPVTSEQALAIQDAVTDSLGDDPIGWKLGCTSVEMQLKLGSDGPIAGRAFASRTYRSGACIEGARSDMLGLEAEFAFRMGRDLPPRSLAYTREEVLAAIATLHPAIEQIESRFADWKTLSIHEIVADNASHGRLILGDAIPDWRQIDLPSCPIRLRLQVGYGDEVLAQGDGSKVLGDPVNAMLWLANHLSTRGLGLRAGEVVITGTCTGLTFVPAGVTATVDIVGHGSVSMSFAEQLGRWLG